MRDMMISLIRFETKCLDLMDITTNPMNSPVFASKVDDFRSLHDNFENMNLLHISQSKNSRTDLLAKDARNREITFIHIYQTQSNGDGLRKNVLSYQNLV